MSRPEHAILLIEDDPETAKLLNLHINSGLYQLSCCSHYHESINKVGNEDYSLILLDIPLPNNDGIEICKRLRQQSIKTPIMMLSSHAGEAEKVLALELGVDDYVTKPFGMLELMARIKALVRRASLTKPKEQKEEKTLRFRDIAIDCYKMKASLNGQRLELTPKEFDLLSLLVKNPGKTFSRHELLEQVWGYAFKEYEHTITSHINRLRIKIESDLNFPKYILTSWGKGYRFSE